jgi:hypothetical protein
MFASSVPLRDWGYLRARNPASAMAMPVNAITGPRADHVVVLLIGLPDSAPNPCNANTRPASAIRTPTTTMAPRTSSTIVLPADAAGLRHVLRIPPDSSVVRLLRSDAWTHRKASRKREFVILAGHWPGPLGHLTRQPASIGMLVPVMYFEASEARKSTSSATSSGSSHGVGSAW